MKICAFFHFLLFLTLGLLPFHNARADLAEALNNPAKSFSTTGQLPWVQDAFVLNGSDPVARSGAVSHSQSSGFSTSFTGPGTLRFTWMVASEPGFDFLSFWLDGIKITQISGNQAWATVDQILTAGVHTVDWRYTKDFSVSAPLDAGWVSSLALLPPPGDDDLHVDALLRSAALTNSTLIFNEPSQSHFRARTVLDLQRMDEVNAPATTGLPLAVAWTLTDATSATAAGSGIHTVNVPLAGHSGGVWPALAHVDESFDLPVGEPLSIDPLHLYTLTLAVSYTGSGGTAIGIGGAELGNLRLVSFSGRFNAGPQPVQAKFSAVNWAPGTVIADGTGHSLEVDSPPDAAWLMENEALRFRFQSNTVHRDAASGDIELLEGIPLALPAWQDEVANVCYRLENTTLSPAGFAGGNMVVCLPAGTGVSTSATARLMDAEVNLGPVPLTPAGRPVFDTRFVPAPFLAHEQTPVRYAGAGLTWDVAAGTFTMTGANPIYIRQRELQWLAEDAANGELTDPAAAGKASNEAPWRRTLGTPTNVQIAAAPGRVGILSAVIEVGGPDQTVALHHPAGVSLPLTGTSSIIVNNGSFHPDSRLALSGPIAVTYDRDGFDGGACGVAAAGPGTLGFSAAGNELRVTSDGGWSAGGTLPAGAVIQWGGVHPGAPGGAQPTHRLQNLPEASLLISGTWLDGLYTASGAASRAAAMLLSGIGSPADAARVERPLTDEYATGLADYAGLNVRAGAGGLTASSFLAQTLLANYELKPRSKYCVTLAGVSGIHDAGTASLPASLRLYGYESVLDGLRLSYLDSGVVESATAGSIQLRGPSDFSVAFSKLTFTPDGALEAAELAANSPEVTLRYWQCRFKPDLLEFTPPKPEACTPGSISYLTLSGRVGLGTVSDTPVRGTLAFKPDGGLITPADKLRRGVDSSLPMPPGFVVKGRGTLTYPFAPVGRLRFNAWPGTNVEPASGFLFTAGKMDVPFFEDLPVLLHLEPGQFTTPAYVIGGWPSAPSQPDRGWSVNKQNFFTHANFDPANRGYPGASLTDFRNGLENQFYRPHVHKDWRGILDFEFPVQWNAASRDFSAAAEKRIDLIVMSAKGQLKSLDASGAELAFGTELVKLPNINIQAFTNALADLTSLTPQSAGKKLTDALSSALLDKVSQPLLRQGTVALDRLMDDTLDKLVDAPLQAAMAAGATALSSQVDALHAKLKLLYTGGSMAAVRAAGGIQAVSDARTALIDQLQNGLLAATDAPTSAVSALNARLAEADAALQQLQSLCDFNQPAVSGVPSVNPALPAGQSPLLQSIARQVITQFLNSDFTATGSEAGKVQKLLHDLTEEARPVLRQIVAALLEARGAIAQMRHSLDGAAGSLRDLRGQMQAAFTNANALADAVLADFLKQTADSRDAAGRWFDEVSPDQFRQKFARVLIDKLRGSGIETQIKQSLKRLLDPVRQTLHTALNSVFGIVNNMVNQTAQELVRSLGDALASNAAFDGLRSAAGSAFNEGGSALKGFEKGYDKVSNILEFAKAQGYARTRGDSLDELRLEASMGISMPEKVGANVFVQIKNLQSDVPSTSCRLPGAVATEITVGAGGGVSLKQKKDEPAKAYAARLEGRFSLNGDGTPNGLDGLIDFAGPVDLGAVSLKEVRLRFGVGGEEAYATAAARGSIWFVEAEADLFLGSTRQLPILSQTLDRETYDTVITRANLPLLSPDCLQRPIIGIYTRVGGYLSLNRIFGIPDSCLLRLNAGRQFSHYLLFPSDGTVNAGIRNTLDVKGSVLCLGVTGQAGILFNVNADLGRIRDEGLGSVFNNISGTARGWAEGCVDYFIGKECARIDIIARVLPNPFLTPPLLFEPVGVEY